MANSVGNPIVIYNPKEMQMNTAFSKAYILESGGGKAGLPGNYMYIDKSVIDAIDKYARDKGSPYLARERRYDELLCPIRKW